MTKKLGTKLDVGTLQDYLSLGYLYLSNKRLLNFSIAVEAIQAYATDQRGYNYRTRSSKKESYVDHLFGLRATWYFPLYKRSVEVYQYY